VSVVLGPGIPQCYYWLLAISSIVFSQLVFGSSRGTCVNQIPYTQAAGYILKFRQGHGLMVMYNECLYCADVLPKKIS